MTVTALCADQLELYVVMETEPDSNFLLDVERLQTEQTAPAALRVLQEVDVERL